MSGPYFEGQLPASCGHYYPDVLRLRDERRDDGTFVRIVDCIHCGKYEIELDRHQLDGALVRKLDTERVEIANREEELSKVRKKAMVAITTSR